MIQLIIVPYDSGRRGYRMGCGPERLLQSGLVRQLEALGLATSVTTIETEGNQVEAAFDIGRKVAVAVREAVRSDAFPVILAGNCITTLGGFAGLDGRVGVLWFDAHADFNTPETSPSGFLDGMALAVITGRCYRDRSAQQPGFAPLADSELVLIGTRSVDEGEAPTLEHVAVVQRPTDVAAAVLTMQRPELYVHVDLDVLDPAILRANEFATSGGLETGILIDCLTEATRHKRIAAIAITAYDPAVDVANAAPRIVLDILRTVLLHPDH